MKSILKIFWTIYNTLVNILGHLVVIVLLIGLGYYLHLKNLLYWVLIALIGFVVLIAVIAIICAVNANKRLKANNIDTNDFKKAAMKLKNSLKNNKTT